MRFDLVGQRHWFFIGSGVLVVIALIVLAIPPTLRAGIEFTAGTTTQIQFEGRVDEAELRDLYASLDHPEVRIQSVGANTYLIRTSELTVPEGSFTEVAPEPTAAASPPGPQPLVPVGTVTLGAEGASGEVLVRSAFHDDPCDFFTIVSREPVGTSANVVRVVDTCDGGARTVYEITVGSALGYVDAEHVRDFVPAATGGTTGDSGAPDQGERTVIENALRERFGAFDVLEFASVSAVVSTVAVRNATVAMIVAAIFILAYVAWAFSSVPRPFRYGASAIIALLHDVIIVVGAFSLFGKLFGTEVNLMFVTGLLTVIGFSVHDTIVVFDRIRENVTVAPNAPFEDNVNAALVQTLARSLNTSITVLITVMAMLLLGGVTIRDFLLVILIGVISGVYSSIAIAAQVLVAWENDDFRRWLHLGRRSEPHAAA
ncbi:MAG: protein translocase subunit SecF [Dehalococcoidia bacterium]